TEAQLREDVRRRDAQRRREVLARLVHPIRAMRPIVTAWPALGELLAQRPLPPTSLDRRVGPTRQFALIRSRLDVVKKVAHMHGATVNDVLLAVVAGGLRDLLRSRGEAAESELRAYVPISLHQLQGREVRGNLISQMVVALPIGARDRASALRQISAETARSKAKSHPSLGWMPHSGIAGRAFLRLVGRQRVNVTTADLPGPPTPLYFAGARVLEVFPLTQLIANVSIGIAAISYAGQFNLMVVADGDAYPDIDVFAKSCEKELDALALGAGATTPPAVESPRAVVAAAVGG
ncbi:MAG TPA: WS/DGAT domain-containing protein, partial [Candidatus Dormibacteraeota bacterium]|nr:WS/DGAT domain-containing protein [Candidatus Dormibacteraeota bacterium]